MQVKDYKGKTINKIFEERAGECPDKLAIIDYKNTINYRDLNILVNKYAHAFLQMGVNKGDRIAILLDNNIDTWACIMAIIKLSCVYVPLDIFSNVDRQMYCIEDASCNLVVSKKKYSSKLLKVPEAHVLNIDEIDLNDYDQNYIDGLNLTFSPNDTVYIIYTSGTTGKAKGVEISHKNLISLLTNLEKLFKEDGDKTRYILNTSLIFDVSISELFTFFFAAAHSLFINRNDIDFSIENLVSSIISNEVSRLNVAPSLLIAILDYVENENISLDCLKYIFSAGEELKADLSNRCHRVLKNTYLYNLYGPTEATVYVSYYRTKSSEEEVAIGKPFEGTNIIFMDEYGNLNSISGEILLSGDSLARSYHNKKELTESSFVYHLYNGETKRYYHTGDLGEMTETGDILFKGRKDRQIKIRGIRVELGEIENIVATALSNSKVSAIYKKGESYSGHLYIFVEGKEDKYHYEKLKASLPRFVFPLTIHYLDVFPLSATGKIDYKELSKIADRIVLDGNNLSNEYELQILKICREIFPDKNIKEIDYDFFQLGGNSLLVAKLVLEIKKIYQIQISFNQIYQHSRLSDIAQFIENAVNLNRKDEIFKIWRSYLKDCELKHFNENNKEYYVCYSDEPDAKEKIENMYLAYGQYYLPDYLFSKSQIDDFDKWKDYEIKSAEADLFSDIEIDSRQEIAESLFNLKSLNKSIYDNLTAAEVENVYPCMNIQDFFIASGKKEVLNSTYTLEGIRSTEEVRDLLVSLINALPLMRTYIAKNYVNVFEQDNYPLNLNYFVELSDLKDIKLLYCDISDYSPKVQQEYIDFYNNKLSESIYEIDLGSEFTHLFYRIAVYKVGLMSYQLDFMFDHKIFDGKSRSIMRNHIYKILNDNKSPEKSTYSEYVGFMDKISTEDKFFSYRNSKEYRDLCHISERLDSISDLCLSESTVIHFDIKKYKFEEAKYADFYECLALYLYVKLIAQNFNLEKSEYINVRLTNNARYFNNNFENLIGDFHFYSIFTVNVDVSLSELIQKLSEYRIRMFDEDKIFLDYMAHKKFSHTDFAAELRDKFRTCKFAFNFIGNIAKEEIASYRQFMSKPITNYYLCMTFLCENTMGLILPNGLNADVKKFEEYLNSEN